MVKSAKNSAYSLVAGIVQKNRVRFSLVKFSFRMPTYTFTDSSILQRHLGICPWPIPVRVMSNNINPGMVNLSTIELHRIWKPD